MSERISFDRNNGEKFFSEKPEIDLMKQLVERTISAGHMLSFKEASEDPEMVQPNRYAFYFGSFSKAARIAQSMAEATLLKKPPPDLNFGDSKKHIRVVAKLPPKPSQVIDSLPETEVRQMDETQPKGKNRRTKRYSVFEVKELLMDFYKQKGRLPTQKEVVSRQYNLPNINTIHKYFGPKKDWEAILLNGVIPQDPHEGQELAPPTPDEPITKESEDVVEEQDYVPTPPEEPTEETSDVVVETTSEKQEAIVTIEVKITLPDREKPVLISLTV